MTTYASHGLSSAARKGDRALRGPLPPTQPVNASLHAMREDWDLLTIPERVDRARAELLFIADPVSQLDEHDHDTLADYTLGELYHARLVLLRLLPLLIEAAR
jgi:hypothetical protein